MDTVGGPITHTGHVTTPPDGLDTCEAADVVVVMLDSPRPPGEASVVSITVTPVTMAVTMMSDGLSPGLLDSHYPPPLLGQLHSGLGVRVEHREVGDDDRDGEGDHEDPGEGAEGANYDPGVGLGHHVPVTHRRHCDNRPPQPLRNRFEVVLGINVKSFRVVNETRKDDHSKNKEENQ